MKKILCIAVHPDDETLGAGGSLLKWKLNGNEIHWLIVTKVDLSLGYTHDQIEKRNKEIERVNNRYGFASVSRLNFITTKLDQYPLSDLVGEISKVITAIKPETIVIPFRHDAHSDHRITYEALMPFMKSFRYPFIKNVMTMETLSETGYAVSDAREAFVPNFFVDISKTLSEKVSIMKEYDGELGIHPFPRSEIGIQAQAQLRGSFINTEYAEAFHLLKSIES